ncbi:MAG TPA: tellurite resistance TerB family protein [Candidatus Thermoplasmatota archaeon]|jgi:hypothetical protein|nr:tellurite resistance TerB family protein [Candidatus Thermoplasmatota archaeon]
MALLDPGSEDHFTAAQGVAGVVLYAVIADEVATDEEMDGLRTMLGRMDLFRDPAQIDVSLRKALRIAKARGDEGMLALAATGVPANLRATAFALAVDLVMADKDVSDEEEACIERIQAALGVPDDVAHKIVEVLVIKNEG